MSAPPLTDEQILEALFEMFGLDAQFILLKQEADHLRVVSTTGPEGVAEVLRGAVREIVRGGAYDRRDVRRHRH